MLSRWSIGAYGALVDVNGIVPKGFDGEPLPYLPFQGSHVYAATWGNLGLNWGMLCLHTLVYLGVTWLVQKRKDIF